MLGETTGYSILIDRAAAGWGWFVDPTPLNNSEFTVRLASGALGAASGSPAYGHMDLLTTVLHELGNAMGFKEDAGQDVTGMTLQAGVRTLPAGGLPGPDNSASTAPQIPGAADPTFHSGIRLNNVSFFDTPTHTAPGNSGQQPGGNNSPTGWGASLVWNTGVWSPGGATQTVDWSANFAKSSNLDGDGRSSDWLDDFVNHLGKNQKQRNANFGMRVRI
jgi:hypothetical protein